MLQRPDQLPIMGKSIGQVGPTIEMKHLCKAYGRSVLDDLSLALNPGEITALIGRSGCGKTTLLHALAGLATLDSGTITPVGIARLSAILFQDHRLLPWMSVEKNLSLALLRNEAMDRDSKQQAVAKMLLRLGLEDHTKARPAQLSGGQAQRAALGRALLQEPTLLLMDEPFAALDAITRADMHDLLLSLHAARPHTILFVTHDLQEATRLADRILVMQQGQIVEDVVIPLCQPRDLDSSHLRHFQSRLRRTISGFSASTHHSNISDTRMENQPC